MMAGALAALLAAPTPARCADPDPAVSPVAWSPLWPRFRGWEYAGTLALGLTALVLETQSAPRPSPRWSGELPIDGPVRGWLRADTARGRERAAKISDLLWLGGGAFPLVVDLPVALLAHRRPEVAWQMLMMDLEAFAVAGLINRALEFGVARARPAADRCAQDPGYSDLCGNAAMNTSFPSGHTLGVATSAGLTCVHHRYLPLYGSPLADAGACALMTAATVLTAAGRVAADRHHASDVLFGSALGFGVGYGLPWLLHYRHGAAQAEPSRALVVPLAAPGVLGLGLAGAL